MSSPSSKLKLYVNEVATTSRAVLALVEATGLEVERISVDLQSGEHYGPEFSALNPNRMVPVLVDGDFVLTESSAILRYLAAKVESPLYPSGLEARARVDEMIAWFESNFYKDFGFQFVYPQLFPHHARGSSEADQATVAFGRARSLERLSVLDDYFLADGRPFLTGDALTIADFHGLSILSLGELVGASLDAYPRVKAWYDRVRSLDAWREINAGFDAFVSHMSSAPSERAFVGLQ